MLQMRLVSPHISLPAIAWLLICPRCHAAPIRIAAKTITADPVYGTAITHVTLTAMKDRGGDGSLEAQVNLQIAQAGFISPVADKELVTNQAGTIGAINFKAATKRSNAYLALAHGGEVLLITNFSDRLVALCRKKHKHIGQFDNSIISITGDVLHVVSQEYPRVEYDLRVRVSQSGRLSLLSYRSVDVI